MNHKDDDGIDEVKSSKTFSPDEADLDDTNTDSESDETSCRLSTSLDWQTTKSPYRCSIFGWGNTVDGELGLGGIEEQHIPLPHEISFNDSENIKYGKLL